ncbi:MAG: type II toxin-antitoxin system VapC family toxin [Blastocatellia bacterium]|jgi:predicted nucleic acid-binding protein
MAIYYIETTIPSFYHEIRSEPVMIARREWTRKWLDTALKTERIVSSNAVLLELASGDFPGREEAIQLLDDLELLSIGPEVAEIVDAYIKHKLMPKDPVGDALHLALASYHRCDFLVTWNCQHLANAKKFGHIRRLNGILGLYVPELVTPMELLGENWNS